MGAQVKNGKALEYAFLFSLYKKLKRSQDVKMIGSKPLNTAYQAFRSFDEKDRREMLMAAGAGNDILLQLEPRLHTGLPPLRLTIQRDARGAEGDVRDVVAIRSADQWEIGISCKNNHTAIKHSRLSPTINFGAEWFRDGIACTQNYFEETRPLFDELADMSAKRMKWSQISDTEKAERFYAPLMKAFANELQRLDQLHPGEIPKRLLSHMLGKQDFYKAIVRRRNRTTELQGFNLYGTLNQSAGSRRPQLRMPRLKLPNRFYEIHFKPESKNTVIIACDEGWTISARIHNASSWVEKSMKLDVKLEGLPPTLYQHVQSW